MALSRTLLRVSESAADFGTGGYSPTAFVTSDNSLLVAIITVMQNGGATDPSSDITLSSSPTLTWTRRHYTGDATEWSRGIAIFTAPVTTGASTTLTADCGARNIWVYHAHVIGYTGYDTSTPTGATANSTGSLGTDGAASITLSGAPASTSEVVSTKLNAADSGTCYTLEGSGWTELADEGSDNYIQTQVRGGSTSTTVAWQDLNNGSGTLANAIALALEIRAAVAATVYPVWRSIGSGIGIGIQ
jgi:hypothetical protein